MMYYMMKHLNRDHPNLHHSFRLVDDRQMEICLDYSSSLNCKPIELLQVLQYAHEVIHFHANVKKETYLTF